MVVQPPVAVQASARWAIEQRALLGRGGTARAVAVAHMLANGIAIDDGTADFVETILATTFMSEGYFPGEPGFPNADRILASLVGGQRGWTRRQNESDDKKPPLVVADSRELFMPLSDGFSMSSLVLPAHQGPRVAADATHGGADTGNEVLTKKLLRVQRDLSDQLTAIGEAALADEISRDRKTLPDLNVALSAASTDEVMAAIAQAYDGLRYVATRRIAAARNRIIEVISEVTGISLAAAKRNLADYDRSIGFDVKQSRPRGAAAVAATAFVAILRDRIRRAVLNPSQPLGINPPGEVVDPALSGARAAAREAIGIAAGTLPPNPEAPPEERSRWMRKLAAGLLAAGLINAITKRKPPEENLEDPYVNYLLRDDQLTPDENYYHYFSNDLGLAQGQDEPKPSRRRGRAIDDEPTVVDVEADDRSFRWIWAPGIYKGGTYEPHLNRDGEIYSGPDDPRLSTADDPFLSQIAEFDYPGIFDACGCVRAPVWRNADVSALTNDNAAVAASAALDQVGDDSCPAGGVEDVARVDENA